MRYVDDIRLFARRESDLRKALIRLDRLSKDVGLFPQSSKIEIHEVTDIRTELKSVSQPTEAVVRTAVVDQTRLRARITELSSRYKVKVQGATRFKYLLAHAQPNAALTARLWEIYDRAPEYYEPIARYLQRYERLPKKPAEHLVRLVAHEALYQAVPATFLRVAKGRIPDTVISYAKRQLKPLWKPRAGQPDLTASLGRWLVSVKHMTDSQLEYAVRYCRPRWVRSQLLFELSPSVVDHAVLKRLITAGVQDKSLDAALAAAYVAGLSQIKPGIPTRVINNGAKCLLKEFGLIKRAAVRTCGIEISLRKLLGSAPTADWRRFFGGEYINVERQIIECRGYVETNATAWVNALDVFNDYLLLALYGRDGTLGGYTFGRPGAVLNSTGSRLGRKYPRVFAYAKSVHDKRAESLLSHPRIRTTGRATVRIPFRYIQTSKGFMRRAMRELDASGLA